MAEIEALVPAPVKEIVVQNSDGKTFSTRLKGADGKFKAKEKSMPSSRELTRWGRNLLAQAEAGPDGKVIKGTQTRHRKIFDNMVRIASYIPPDTTSEGDKAKWAMASGKTMEILYRRFFGKETVSDEELEAVKQSGVKFVLVQAPTLINNVPKEDVKAPTKPSFVDAEVVQQN
jgi:hypothetical protein